MEKDVFDLKIGKDIYQVDYDHSSGKFTDKKLIESDKNIIVCGLHASYNNHYNIKIFMDTEEELKIKWKIERDIEKRSYSKEKILKQISDRKKDYIKYILPQKNLSDIVVNYKIEKEKLILNLGVKKETKFQWYKFTEGDYNQIILNFIKNIY